MTGQITYGEAGMATAISSIQNTFKQYTSNLDEVMGRLDTSMQNWEASPRELYEGKRAAWLQQANDRAQKLSALPGQLQQIADTYAATNRSVTATWS